MASCPLQRCPEGTLRLNPEDVLWDQYANSSGANFAAQDLAGYDIYDVWTADDFENLEPWTIDTIVTRGGWTGSVDISGATIHQLVHLCRCWRRCRAACPATVAKFGRLPAALRSRRLRWASLSPRTSS